MGTILNDPVILRFRTGHESFRLVMGRMSRVLIGDDKGHDARVSTAMFTVMISGTVTHPLVASLNDATLRFQLRHAEGRPPPAMS